jgi:Ca2+-binding EF-hand superfamily protein
LKGKEDQLLSVALEIDQNNDGSITRGELQKYLDEHGIEAHIDEEKVNLMEFLKKYSSRNSETAP